MKYQEDGEYSIDNNIAERNIRPACVERNSSMGFASEEGIERSATFHTIVQTCRLMKVRVLKYFETFFEKYNTGCRDFVNMIPGQLVLK
ncbi:IS66 family transposase [Segatella bryantii]|uniref:IS66 family transposase n=1 Tax=Segatella bryantii TaxID=77095 RepID=UPI00241D8CC7|nr:transposase [Segatella bryantii]